MDSLLIELGISAIKALVVTAQRSCSSPALLGWVERKGSALIQDRIGANRAAIFGFAGARPGQHADGRPAQVPHQGRHHPGGRRPPAAHAGAVHRSLFPALVTFAVIPFGDVLVIGDREINLQVAPLDIGILYVLAMVSLGVYGVVLGGWASNNRWSLLGGIRGSAQMISYELAMGLALVAMIMTYGTLDLQAMARAQGGTILGFIPPGASSISRSRS